MLSLKKPMVGVAGLALAFETFARMRWLARWVAAEADGREKVLQPWNSGWNTYLFAEETADMMQEAWNSGSCTGLRAD